MQRFPVARESIQRAQTPEKVWAVLDGCMSSMSPEWIVVLPLMCQHIIETKSHDISAIVAEMVRMEGHFMGSEEMAQVLHEIAQTYGAAASRLVALGR